MSSLMIRACKQIVYSQNELRKKKSSNHENIFLSEESSSEERTEPKGKEKKAVRKNKRGHNSHGNEPSTSGDAIVRVRSSGKKSRSAKVTAQDLFGVDSDDGEINDVTCKNTSPLVSYLTKRVTNGFSRQIKFDKPGSHFVEIKIYKCEEIERVSPMNRWRYAIVALKNRTNVDTESWRHLSAYLSEVRKEFKECSPNFINSHLL
ncbi:unnamed protein product, partial [Brenthis ino]